MTMPLAFLDEQFGPSDPQSEKIVVSLTSWPKRINLVYKVIDNMLRQTRRPDKVVLYLSKTQFPDRQLPHLLKLRLERDPRFEVRYTSDIGSHKKYYRAFKDFPDAAIVLVDDDIVYPDTMLCDLMVHYHRNPHVVTCLRSHTVAMTRKKTFAPYLEWMKERKIVNEASPLVLATTGGGTIFPPNSLPPEAFDIDGIRKLAPTADDLWLKWHLLANRVPSSTSRPTGRPGWRPSPARSPQRWLTSMSARTTTTVHGTASSPPMEMRPSCLRACSTSAMHSGSRCASRPSCPGQCAN